MPFFDPIRIGASGAAEDFTVDRSLRFNDGDSPSLTRSPSGDGNKQTFTFSWWQKITQPNDYPITFSVGSTSITTGFWEMRLGSVGLYLRFKDSSTVVLNSNDKFRDPSAWYHCVIAVDTTKATNSERIKMYVNNRQITSFENTNYPSQNLSFRVNTTDQHQWGYGKSSSGAVDGPLDSYLAEINFIDGQQLTPSSFAETGATTGQWNPIDTSGLTFGTNGYRLQFSDNSGTTATTLGKDSSGNGNNFTPNNFSVAAGIGNDSVIDTPTNNFCTYNPLNKSNNVTLSEGNLKFTQSSQDRAVTGTMAMTSGKWYYEFLKVSGDNPEVGILPTDSPNPATNGQKVSFSNTNSADITGFKIAFLTHNGNQRNGIDFGDSGSITLTGGSAQTGAGYIGIAIDMDNKKIWYTDLSGNFFNSGDPANGTNEAYDFSSTQAANGAVPFVYFATASDDTGSVNFGQQPFNHTQPTGFKTLSSANLPDPTILLPNKHFDTLLYTGNDSTNAITGLNFVPDWVWIKNRSSAVSHYIVDSLRRSASYYKYLNSNETNAEGDATRFTSIDSGSGTNNGFTLPSGGSFTNANGDSYVAWNWNAGDTDSKTYTVTVVDDSGNKFRFDGFGTSAVTLDLAEGGTYIFNYPSGHPFRFSTTADGTHGGGSEYTTGVTHNSSTQVTIVVAASAPTLYYYCSSHSGMGGQVNTNSTLGSSNFDGTIQNIVKANATAGFSVVTWTGNGSSGSTLGHGLGVAPKAIITKQRNSSGSWATFHNALGTGSEVYLDLTQQATSSNFWVSSPTSSVFTVSGSDYVNENTSTYVGYCFSEVAGFSKFGSFGGNGSSSDGTYVFLGFRPALVIFKNSTSTEAWSMFDNKRDPDNPVEKFLRPSGTNADTSGSNDIDFLSNGFKARTSNNPNTSGATYIYLAFSESPFKNARAR